VLTPANGLRAGRSSFPARTGVFRLWLVVGLAGLGLLLAAPSLLAAWRVDVAGLALNRQLHSGDRALIPAALALLGNADGPHDPSFWRTYGAAAARLPSEKAFVRLKAARDRGELDRIGQLWLGEVAAATRHWEEVQQAYSRVDAVNMLVERGDTALKAGNRDLARNWYGVAAANLRAAVQRDSHRSSADRALTAGADPGSDGLPVQGTRAVFLLRIGRGFLALDWPEAAVPVLEMALTEMTTDPPGVREQQTILFTMAQALAKNELPKDKRSRIVEPAAVRPPGSVAAKTEARIRALLAQSLELDRTGWAELQAGQVLSLIGDRHGAMVRLRAALRLDPRLPDAYLILGSLLETADLTDVARDIYAKGMKTLSSNQPLQLAWALASYRTMTPEAALPILEKVGDTSVRDPYLFAALGDTYLKLGREKDAVAAYREGLGRSPGAKPLLDRLARFSGPLWRARS
jgi:tetratricopeptide (TPR) repeat protein